MVEQSTASTLKKQLSFNNTEENIKKNRSVTFQNNDKRVSQTADKKEMIAKQNNSNHKQEVHSPYKMHEYDNKDTKEYANGSLKIGETI